MAAITGSSIRVVRLDADGCPTGEAQDVEAFDLSFQEVPQEPDDDHYFTDGLKSLEFTMDLCWAPGGQREFLEMLGLWKYFERARSRSSQAERSWCFSRAVR